MSTATVTAGKDTWVGSARPNATHFSAPRLRVDQNEALAFVHLKSPVPPGDTVSTATVAVTVAVGATGSFTFSLKRVATRPDWSDMTWDNKPGVTGTAVTVAVTDPAAGDVLEFTGATMAAHVQAVADGDPNYGWRIESNNTTAVKLSGFDSEDGPTLEVEWSSQPAEPTDLVPQGVVSLTKPFLQFSAPDSTGEDELNAVHVQTAATSNPAADGDGTWTSPAFDSGTVSSTVPELDLSTTAFTALTDGQQIYWHVRWRNTLGVWSPWSDTVSLTRTAKSALTIDNPPVGGTVLEPTPPFLATFAGTAVAWRVRIVDTADNRIVQAKSGKRAATSPTAIAWTPDEADRLEDGTTYDAVFDVWDNVNRTASVGDPTYTRATRTFTVDEEVTVTAPTAVSVTTDPDLPVALVNVTRASAPDFFVLRRNGAVVQAEIDPSDVFVSGTSYAIPDTRLRQPMVDQDYQVRAVVNGEQSAWSSIVTGAVNPSGVWLISQDRAASVVLANPVLDMSTTDDVGMFKVHGKEQLVQIRASLGAHGGSYSGDLYPTATKTTPEFLDDLETLRELDEPVFLIAADYAALVRLRDVSSSPHPHTKDGRIWRRVSFSFIESDR